MAAMAARAAADAVQARRRPASSVTRWMTKSPSKAFALIFVLLVVCGCAGSSGTPATAIAQPEIAAAYLPLYGRIHLGLDSANGAAMVIAPGLAVTNAHNANLLARGSVIG